jgi:hypothetical protein
MSLLNKYVILILIVKIIFIILVIANIYLKTKIKIKTQKQETQETQEHIEFWKGRIELIFKCLMTFLLIYLFNPRENRINLINVVIKLLFFSFGIMLIFTANWKQFYTESPFFEKIQSLF